MLHFINFSTVFTKTDLSFAIWLIFFAAWVPAHYFFKWLRGARKTEHRFWASIIGCITLSILLIIMGIKFGQHLGQPAESLWASGADGLTVDENLMWLPFALFAGGIWGGFLSGYLKVPIDK